MSQVGQIVFTPMGTIDGRTFANPSSWAYLSRESILANQETTSRKRSIEFVEGDSIRVRLDHRDYIEVSSIRGTRNSKDLSFIMSVKI